MYCKYDSEFFQWAKRVCAWPSIILAEKQDSHCHFAASFCDNFLVVKISLRNMGEFFLLESLKGEVSQEFGVISNIVKSFLINRNLKILFKFVVDFPLSFQCSKTINECLRPQMGQG